jgi:hypothetical protein
MNIYHIERTDGSADYDEFSDFVIVAESEEYARNINPESIWRGTLETIDTTKRFSSWVQYDDTKATLLGEAEERYIAPEIICASFHAG